MENEQGHQPFRLIAIRPRKGCSPKYCKVLKPGEIYQFYQDYSFHLEEGKGDEFREVAKITYADNPSVPEGFYDQGNLRVNISAVVGKNGSGKSTLMELLYYAVYCLGTNLTRGDGRLLLEPNSVRLKTEERNWKEEIGEKSVELKTIRKQLKEIAAKTHLTLKDRRKCLKLQEQKQQVFERMKELRKNLQWTAIQIKEEDKAEREMRNGLRISVFYEQEGIYYELVIDPKDKATLIVRGSNPSFKDDATVKNRMLTDIMLNDNKNLDQDQTKKILDSFFYTISLNYSHYALNSNHLGSWISRLFHKNDAYSAPISINPMRTDGNFDINDENDFAAYRLLFNLILRQKENEKLKKPEEPISLTDNQVVKKVRFRLNPEKLRFKGEEEYAQLAWKQLEQESYEDKWSFLTQDQPSKVLRLSKISHFNNLTSYVVKKVAKIVFTYRHLYEKEWHLLTASPGQNNFTQVFERLRKDDNSHITFKLRQAIHYIQTHLKSDAGKKHIHLWKTLPELESEEFVDFDLKELSDWVGKATAENLMQRLPPSIFSIDYVLSGSLDGDGKPPTFNSLSSGEQQLIHTTQNIIYHLNNLRSAWKGGKGTQAYGAVNIVIDEIELYFHPEYQRQFASVLLKAINRLNLGTNKDEKTAEIRDIRAINILLNTHSPFILSDIPRSNLLFLEVKDEKAEPQLGIKASLGANIHEMLRNGFFMKDGTIGELAKDKIKAVIQRLSENPEPVEDQVVRKWRQDELRQFIYSIGEPVVREMLLKMYHRKNTPESGIDEEIRILQESKRQKGN